MRNLTADAKNAEKYEASSKFWKTFTIVGLPAAALLSGLTVGLVMAR
jgi:hypothetical protein